MKKNLMKKSLALLLVLMMAFAAPMALTAYELCCESDDCTCDPGDFGSLCDCGDCDECGFANVGCVCNECEECNPVNPVDPDELNRAELAIIIDDLKLQIAALIVEHKVALGVFENLSAMFDDVDALMADFEETEEHKAFIVAKEKFEGLSSVYNEQLVKYNAGGLSHGDLTKAWNEANDALKVAETALLAVQVVWAGIELDWAEAMDALGEANDILSEIAALEAKLAEQILAYNTLAQKDAKDANDEAWEEYWLELKAYSVRLSDHLRVEAIKTAEYLAAMKEYRTLKAAYPALYQTYLNEKAEWNEQKEAYDAYLIKLAAYNKYLEDIQVSPTNVIGSRVTYQGQGNETSFRNAINPLLPTGVSVARNADVNSSGVVFTVGAGAVAGYFDIAIQIGDRNNDIYNYRVIVDPVKGTTDWIGANPPSGWGTDFRVTVGAFVEAPENPDPVEPPVKPEKPEAPVMPTKPEINKFNECPPVKPELVKPGMQSYVVYDGEELDGPGEIEWNVTLQLAGLPQAPTTDDDTNPPAENGGDEPEYRTTTNNPPAAPATIEIADTAPPLASMGSVDIPEGEEIVIIDEEIPLGNLPQTGGMTSMGAGIVGMLIALTALGAAAVAFPRKDEK